MTLPKGWKFTTLGSVLERVVLPVVVEPSREYRQIGIRSHGKGIFHKPAVTGETLGEKRVFSVVPDALILNIVFAWEQAVAVTSAREAGMVASHRFPMYLPANGACDVRFLLQYFKTPRGKELLEIASPGGAGRNKTLGQQQFERLRVPMPPLSEQIDIANALALWDAAITSLDAAVKASTLQHHALRNDLTTGQFPRSKTETQSWTREKLASLGSTFPGLSGKSKTDFGEGAPYIPYLNIFKNSRIDINSLDLVTVEVDESQNRCQFGDIFFTTSSETPDEVGMASVLLDKVDELYLNSFSFGFRLHKFDRLLPEYARFLFRSSGFRERVQRIAQGSTRFNLSKKGLLDIEIALPPLAQQRRVAEILDVSERLVSCQTAILSAQRFERDSLAQILLSGKRRTVESRIGDEVPVK
jgi:type I restriction enzyme S subunit